jgi:two-component system, chemotaxis family, sensor kinase Cph1
MALRGYRETIKQLRVEVTERHKTEQQLHETALALSRERDLLQQRVSERTETLRIQADELTRKNEELKRRNSQLDDFAHIAAHDLKEPLRSISMHISILLEESGPALDEESSHRLYWLAKLTGRMEQLVADLLRYSNLEYMGQTAETVDLMDVMAGLEATLADALQMRNARILVPEPLPTVRGSRVLLTSLFHNLITNGTKYNDAPEKIVEIGSVPSAAGSEPVGFDVFYVRDNGIGIDEQFHEEIFRLFKRLNSEKTSGKGTGAGLTFVKKIVEIHGGRIWLTSRSGKGATFYFTLLRSG